MTMSKQWVYFLYQPIPTANAWDFAITESLAAQPCVGY